MFQQGLHEVCTSCALQITLIIVIAPW